MVESEAVVQQVQSLVQGSGVTGQGKQREVVSHGNGAADTQLVVAPASYQRITGLARHQVHHQRTGFLQHPHQFVGVLVIGYALEEVPPVREEQQIVLAIQHEVHHAVEAVLQLEDDFHVVLAEHQGMVDAEEEGGTGGFLDERTHGEGVVISRG